MNGNAKLGVEALRSGNYKQARATLHDGEGYCCLGVATDLFCQAQPEAVRRQAGPSGDRFYDARGKDAAGRLLDPIAEWLGVRLDDWATNTFPTQPLINMNDRGRSFAEIADFIESEPVGLFAPLDA